MAGAVKRGVGVEGPDVRVGALGGRSSGEDNSKFFVLARLYVASA